MLAAGAESVFLAEPIGIRLPIYPVKGFSITAPLVDPAGGPRMGLVDEDRLVAMSPVRRRGCARPPRRSSAASTTATGRRTSAPSSRLTRALYGDAVDYARAVHWTGLRPMTPSSVPILGRSRYRNLYLNVGHGHVGWSMCCGSGQLVADSSPADRPRSTAPASLAA